MPLAIQIHPDDNVVVALHPIAKGTAVPVGSTTVTAAEDIPQGHKMAIAPIHKGENVIKYGFPIGYATADAAPGAWMHTHNVHTNLSGEIEYTYHPNVHPLAPVPPETFLGYRRPAALPQEGKRNGVFRVDEFYCRLLGVPDAPDSIDQWLAIPEPSFAAATNREMRTFSLRRRCFSWAASCSARFFCCLSQWRSINPTTTPETMPGCFRLS